MRFIFLGLILMIACSEPAKNPYRLPQRAESYLTADSLKSWKLASRYNNGTRMNMGDCFLAYQQTYSSEMKMMDNAGSNRDCGEHLKAQWRFVKDKADNYYIRLESDQIPTLLNIEENYKLFRVLYLSMDTLKVSFRHKQFSNKSTTITDYYVPIEVTVENRDFHW